MDTTFETDPLDYCLNCDEQLSSGKYCAHCGQKRIDKHEFAIRHFFGHLIHEITHLDSNKISRTFRHLISRPGLPAAEYLAGRKGKYINPIRVYLTVSAIYFLFAWGALSSAGGSGVEVTASRPNFVRVAERKGVGPTVLAVKAHEKAGKYSAFLRFASVLISGLFLSLLYVGMGKYYVEHLIFSLYFYSFDFLAKCVVAIFYITSDYTSAYLYPIFRTLYYVSAFAYLVLALKRVYRQAWPATILKGSILFALEVILFVAVNIAGFVVAVALV